MVLSSSTIKDGTPSPLEKANREINQNLNKWEDNILPYKLGFMGELRLSTNSRLPLTRTPKTAPARFGEPL